MIKTTATQVKPGLSFFHSINPDVAYRFALEYMGPKGHLATIEDIVSLRLRYPDFQHPIWQNSFVTNSAEYFGRTSQGVLTYVIAHGVGPLSTREGLIKAYSPGGRIRSQLPYGKISQQEFDALVTQAGKSNEMFRLQFTTANSKFAVPLSADAATADHLLKARLGPSYLEYLYKHESLSLSWHIRQIAGYREAYHYSEEMDERRQNQQALEYHCGVTHPSIITSYELLESLYNKDALSARPFAHANLLQISGVGVPFYDRTSQIQDMMTSVGCYLWGAPARFIAIPQKTFGTFFVGPENYLALLAKHWRDLFVPHTGRTPSLHRIHRFEEFSEYFTLPPRTLIGEDVIAPFHWVSSTEKVGGIKSLLINKTSDSFTYSIEDILRYAPLGANSFSFEDSPVHVVAGGVHMFRIKAQFYSSNIGTSLRLPLPSEIESEKYVSSQFKLLMKLFLTPSKG